MLIITLRQLKARLLTVLIALLVLLGLCRGVPAVYDFLVAEEEEFEELDDPVRVDLEEEAAFTAEWLNVFGQ